MIRTLLESRVVPVQTGCVGPVAFVVHAVASARICSMGILDEQLVLQTRDRSPAHREWPCKCDLMLRLFLVKTAGFVCRRAHRKGAGRNHHHLRTSVAVLER